MEDTDLGGLSSLVRLSGVNVPARARFIGEALVSSTLTSMTFGLCSGMLGSTLACGPLVPFLVGSWMGYSAGLIRYWQTTVWKTHIYAQQYPSIMAHALATGSTNIEVPRHVIQASEERLLSLTLSEEEYPAKHDAGTLEDWIREGGLGRLTWSVLAAQSCRSDIEELQRKRRERLIEEHQEKFP